MSLKMTFRYQSELLDYKTHLKQSMSEFNITHYFYLFSSNLLS